MEVSDIKCSERERRALFHFVPNFTMSDTSMDKKVWSHRQVSDLINHYESLPCLWDVHAKEYRDRNKKDGALNSLALTFNTTVEEILRKIHNIRNQFNNERRKMVERKGTDEPYISKWNFYNRLKFLHGALVNRSKLGNSFLADDVDDPTTQYSEGNLQTFTINATPGPSSAKRKHTNECSLSSNEDQSRKPGNSNHHDEFAVFGSFVGNEIRGVRSEQLRRRAKRRIQQVLLEIAEEDDRESPTNSDEMITMKLALDYCE